MKTKKKRLNKKAIIIVFAAVVVAIVVVSLYLKNANEPPISVSFAKAERRTIVQTISATGTIKPETQVKISPEVSGEIVNLSVKEGDTVKRGDLLARINPVTIEAQLEQNRALVTAVKEDAKQIKVQSENLATELNRIKELYNKNFASKQELDNAQANYDATLAGYSATLARIESAQATLKQVETEARKTTIFAPLDGIVTSLLVEEGERVVGTSLMTGTEMLTVADLNIMNAEVDVDENDIVLVKIGDTADIEIDAIPDKIFKGVVIEVGHSAGTGTAVSAATTTTTFRVKVRLIDAGLQLRPGMSCNVDIHTAKHTDVIAVPLQAVTSRDDISDTDMKNDDDFDETQKTGSNKPNTINAINPATIVFVNEKNKAKSRQVKIGISDMGFIEILSGLNENEEIISGSYEAISKLLKDGSAIKKDKANAKSKS